MKVFFPIHLDGGNRGCEAIAKGTALILKEKKENLIGLCTDIVLDKELGVDQFVSLWQSRPRTLAFRAKNKLYRTIMGDGWKSKCFSYRYKYDSFLDHITINDMMLSTGGDMMCYEENEVVYTVDYLRKRGIHSVLWGCSIGENTISPRKLDALKKFSVIYARETLTQEVLVNRGLQNVVVYPDPAFVLEPSKCQLPDCFSRGEVIGINLSNYVMGGFSDSTPFAEEVDALIRYILKNTDKQILLIPHVMWKGQDDRIVCQLIKDKYQSNRISTLESDNLNYCQIRYVISKCYCFIGARTHAVISAYSTCTPAIAIGYSIKSKGIAKDVGMPEKAIVNSVDIKKGELLDAFKYVIEKHGEIHDFMVSHMGRYRANAWNASKVISLANRG